MISASRGRGRIGVLVPFTNVNLEADMALLRPSGISFHFTRLGGYDKDEIPDADQMAGLGAFDIDEPLRLLAGALPDVILYGCTSATLTHGVDFDGKLAGKIHQLCGAPTVTAAGALIQALQALGIQRIGFASPYLPTINDHAIAFLQDAGFEVVARADYQQALDNYGQGRLTPEEIFNLARRTDHEKAEAIVLSCTDMRSVEVIDALELVLKKPVVSSNQAMLFSALTLIGHASTEVPCGRLLRTLQTLGGRGGIRTHERG